MHLLRSAGAVIAGYLIFALSAVLWFQLSGNDPHRAPTLGFAVASVVWGIVFAALGGWAATRIGASGRFQPGYIVAALIFSGATASLIASPGEGARWTQISALALMAPAAAIATYRTAQGGQSIGTMANPRHRDSSN